MRGDAYPCAGESWIQLSIGFLNHGKRGTTAYLWVSGMTVCRDKDMAALATIWAENVRALLCCIEFRVVSFQNSSFKSEIFQNSNRTKF